MSEQPRGLYEALLTEVLEANLQTLAKRLSPKLDRLRPADSADRIALHLARLLRHVIEGFEESDRPKRGLDLARALVKVLAQSGEDPALVRESPVGSGQVLRALRGRLPDGRDEDISEPLVPLLDTTLLTNAPGEPRVGRQLLAEMESADRIDAVVAFVRWSGVAPMLEQLGRHCAAGRPFRLLTTTYTNSTEQRALDALKRLGADIRVSYDASSTRLHAKSWFFARHSGFSTAYVGSSNLTHSAQVTGLEWNVRVSGARNPDLLEKFSAVYESYWNHPEFVLYEPNHFARQVQGSKSRASTTHISPLEVRLEPFQERLLEQIAAARERGQHRNLLVSATGTGKTVMAAEDYRRLRCSLPRHRLLFVAHREEILEQSLATFRQVLRDPSFGELWVGRHKPDEFENVFASIQSLSSTRLATLAPDHFDVVIIDEFHHAAARSYEGLLRHVTPSELLGLTATPERSDDQPILQWFGGGITAELRLWDAIDQHRLAPFSYFGVHDDVDLAHIPWRRSGGYDVEALAEVLTGDGRWARLVLDQVSRRTDGFDSIRALGFCVSVKHAQYMARVFSEAGCPAMAVTADTPDDERAAALRDLAERRLNVIFSVDLYNEGIDVKTVDTILMLRPTDSPVLFLQQLGRGLRLCPGKTVCTVLDFVGNHRPEFRMERRFRALLGGTRKQILEQVQLGFPFLPAGCHMELDRVARDVVLSNIQNATPWRWPQMLANIGELGKQGEPELATFLEESGLDLEDVYANGRSWSELKQEAGFSVHEPGRHETDLRRAVGRLLHIDDAERCAFIREMLGSPAPPRPRDLDVRRQRLLRMLAVSLTETVLPKSATLTEACDLLWAHRQVCDELVELAGVLEKRIDHVHPRHEQLAEVPLEIHARYTRIEVLSAFALGEVAKLPTWQSGVFWAKDAKTDLLAFTLDKTGGHFSPTTRYRDYAISSELIHWESQSRTREDSDTGRRYRMHKQNGSRILLFARLTTDDRAFWFLGPAEFVEHEGEMPMAIKWRLIHPLPGDLYSKFAAAVA